MEDDTNANANANAKNNARLDQVMKDFKKVIVDMTRDILTTFPERFNMTNLNEHLKNVFENTDDENDTSLKSVFEHCKKVYPDKFFNILYQNDCIFTSEDIYESEFLPGIIFEELWKDPLLSDKSREVIWKYLQLVLFTIISTINNKESFGESAKMFENINEGEFKNKLEEAMEQIQNIFNFNKSDSGSSEDQEGTEGTEGASEGEGINLGDMPNPQDIHDHVTGMLDGKLGKLAREIAEETAADLNMDMNNTSSVNDVFKNLMKNPTKLMGIVKNVGNKLDEKMKSGDIKESELLKEAGDIMDKMKNIPGMGNIQSMMEKMGMGMGAGGAGGAGGMGNMADMMSSMAGMMGGMGGGGKGKGKVNMNAFENYMKKGAKAEGMKARLAERQAQAQAQQAQAQQAQAQAHATSGVAKQAQQAQAQQQQQPSLGTFKKVDDNIVYSTGEKVERSLVPPSSSSSSSGEGINKKKKKKKNKNKNKKTTEE